MRFDPNHFRQLITTVIILDNLPFSFVEYEAIRITYQYLRPGINWVSRNTLKADVLKMFSREQARIKSMLDLTPGRVCLTSDLWTSIATYGYLILTAHFIDKDWELQKRLLSFCFMHLHILVLHCLKNLMHCCVNGELKKRCFL